MSYSDFTLEKVQEQFKLDTDASRDLFAEIPAVPVRFTLADMLATHGPMATLFGNEKTRSELLIAPVLAEVWFMMNRQISVFSGIEFNVDPEAGLKGVCAFLLALAPHQPILRAPVLAVVEAKRENIYEGLGQCVAEMIAVQRFNAKTNRVMETVYGCVTDGNLWRFLRLKASHLEIDLADYSLSDTGKILAIFLHVVGGPLP